MIDDRYYVKIVPHKGETVHRFQVRRRHIIGAAAALSLALIAAVSFAVFEVARAHAQVVSMRADAAKRQAALKAIDSQTNALRNELQRVQKQNREIRALIGAPNPAKKTHAAHVPSRVGSLGAVQTRVRALVVAGRATRLESDSIKRLALHVLNLRHLRDLARAQMLAAIPSIDPVAGASVIGCFCYRSYPDTEFHEGVDLGADYGDAVRAAAAGTVVANGYDGGYGIKIDIDHGNGYHTWYAHLSHVDVAIGQHVYKGQLIGEVGSTGFSTGPHLHYQVMYDGTPVDPTPFLHGVPSNVIAALP